VPKTARLSPSSPVPYWSTDQRLCDDTVIADRHASGFGWRERGRKGVRRHLGLQRSRPIWIGLKQFEMDPGFGTG
jgi:hypothetical protein